MVKQFQKSFTQQEPIADAAIEKVTVLLRSGRLHRYNLLPDEISEVAHLEEEFAAFQGAKFCVAVTSGGQAMQIALRAAGLKPGDAVLTNAYTLAPVPGAIHAVGGVPVLVEIDRNWHIDLAHFKAQAESSGARFALLSLMRGHIPAMDELMAICDELGITLIEDCAHTMGARWKGQLSGSFGAAGCFSTQTYKHINSGEGGLITTDDPELAARAVITSGSYMLYEKHGARPDDADFERVKLDAPNCSARLDMMRAALIRDQLPKLEGQIARWNERWGALATGLNAIDGISVPPRAQHEAFVGSSIQFHADKIGPERIPKFVERAAQCGIDLKWFGAAAPHAFTSRYDSWRYLGPAPDLPQTRKVLSTTCDMRVPLTFEIDDCHEIVQILDEIAGEFS